MKKGTPFILLALISSCTWFHATKKQSTVPYPNNPYYLYLAGRWAVMKGDIDRGIKLYEKLIQIEPEHTQVILELAGLYFENKKDPIKTYSLLKKVIVLEPENVEVLMSAGELAMALNKLKDAEDLFLKVLSIKSNQPDALLYLGSLKYYQRDFPSAKHYFNQVLVINPNSHLTYYYLANIALREGKLDDAKKYYEKAIEINPHFKNALLELARLYTFTDIDKAIELYNRILEYAPLMENLNIFEVRENLANLYISKNKYSEAVKQLEQVEGVSPAIEIKWKLGLLYLELQQYEKAEKEFNFILSIEPSNTKALLYHAYALINLGDEEKALKEFDKIPPLDPLYPNAQVQIALIYFSRKDTDKAFTILENLRKKGKTIVDVYYLLGSGYREVYRMEDSLKVLKEGYSYYPDNKDIVFLYCASLDEIGRIEESIKVLEEFIKKHNNDADALNFLGYTLLDHNLDIEKAEELLMKAYELKPDAPHIIDSVGWLYFKKGEMKKALEFIEKALNINPNDGIVWEHKGDILLKMGKIKDALKSYEEALTKNLRKKERKRIESKIEKIKSGVSP